MFFCVFFQEFRSRHPLSPQKVPHDATPQDNKTCYAFLYALVPVSIRPLPIASHALPWALLLFFFAEHSFGDHRLRQTSLSATDITVGKRTHPEDASDAVACAARSHHVLRRSSTFYPCPAYPTHNENGHAVPHRPPHPFFGRYVVVLNPANGPSLMKANMGRHRAPCTHTASASTQSLRNFFVQSKKLLLSLLCCCYSPSSSFASSSSMEWVVG